MSRSASGASPIGGSPPVRLANPGPPSAPGIGGMAPWAPAPAPPAGGGIGIPWAARSIASR
ncbi:MAG: hypothetical protein WC072_07155, partial [Methanoregulaceae archaeon]